MFEFNKAFNEYETCADLKYTAQVLRRNEDAIHLFAGNKKILSNA